MWYADESRDFGSSLLGPIVSTVPSNLLKEPTVVGVVEPFLRLCSESFDLGRCPVRNVDDLVRLS